MTLDPEKIKARIAKMAAADLLLWAESAATGMQRYLDDFRRDPDEAYLGEIKLAAISMDLVVDEMAARLQRHREQLARQEQEG